MFRKVPVLLVVVTLLGSLLFGSIVASAAQVELTLWHHWTDHRTGYVQSLLDAFMEEHPDIKVEQIVSPTGGAQDRITAFLVSGASPDLLQVSSGYSFPFMSQGGLYPLDEFIARDSVDLGMFNPGDLNGFQLLGETYGMPVTSAAAWTNLVFYNKDMLGEVGLPSTAPADWDAWREANRRMSKRHEDGTVLVAGTSIPAMHIAAPWAGQMPWSDDWRTAQVNTPRMHETVEFLMDQLDTAYGTWSNYVSFMQLGVNRFKNQELGMWFINNSAFGFTKDFDFNYGVSLAPVNSVYPEAQPIGFVSGTWAYAIPATISDEKLEAAWTLLKWLTTTEEAGGWFTRVQGRPSPVIEFNRHSDYRVDNPYWDVVIQAVGNDVAIPPVDTQLGTFHNQIMNRTVQPFQGLQDAEIALQTALDTYWDAIGQ